MHALSSLIARGLMRLPGWAHVMLDLAVALGIMWTMWLAAEKWGSEFAIAILAATICFMWLRFGEPED